MVEGTLQQSFGAKHFLDCKREEHKKGLLEFRNRINSQDVQRDTMFIYACDREIILEFLQSGVRVST